MHKTLYNISTGEQVPAGAHALATATTQGSNIQKKLSDVRKANLLLQNTALDAIGNAMWPTVIP